MWQQTTTDTRGEIAGSAIGSSRVGVAHRGERRLRIPPAVGQPEVPVVDLEAATVPLVRPREDEAAGGAGAEHRLDLPAENRSLVLDPVPVAVVPALGDDDREVADDVVQTREVVLQALLRLEVDVEGGKVEEGQLEVLRRGVVHVGDERVGVFGLDRLVEVVQEALDAAIAVPARNLGRDLVADRVAEHGRVAGGGVGRLLDAADDRLAVRAALEEGDVVLPRDADHHAEVVLGGEIEQPGRRHGVGPDRVDPVRGHGREVALDRLSGRELVAGLVARERPVRDAPDVELLVAEPEKLSACDDAPLSGVVSALDFLSRFLRNETLL